MTFAEWCQQREREQQAIREYFALPGTPMHSPVGEMMQRILIEEPGLTFDQARSKARECLDLAAGKRHYSPRSPAQIRRFKEKVARRFPASNRTPQTGKSGVSA